MQLLERIVQRDRESRVWREPRILAPPGDYYGKPERISAKTANPKSGDKRGMNERRLACTTAGAENAESILLQSSYELASLLQPPVKEVAFAFSIGFGAGPWKYRAWLCVRGHDHTRRARVGHLMEEAIR